jgi:signal-transduction protein with cAMP-binding, CBS, and nucleotidyltransferase domain
MEVDMTGTVRDWMSKPAVVVEPDASAAYALTLMRRRKIHSVIVDLSEPGRPGYGIVTSTDIRDKIVAKDLNPADLTVRAIMSSPVRMAKLDWSLRECSVQMQALNVHHLAVADESGIVIGVISATDLFTAAEERGWGSGG